MGGGHLIVVAEGTNNLALPTLPKDIASLVAHLLTSSELCVFEHLHYLTNATADALPILPTGHFWYLNDKQWTIRKYDDAPAVKIDLDIYLDNGKEVGHNLSINNNLVDTRIDLTDHKKVAGPRASTYGGYSISDFKNLTSNLSDTRGHGVAYACSKNGITQSGVNINSDSNHRNYSPEKSTTTGGSAYGQSIRNHQLEAPVRQQNGQYREINTFTTKPEQVACGLYVPDVKYLIRILPTATEYAAFKQGLDYKTTNNKNTNDLWNEHIVNSTDLPITLALSTKASTLSAAGPLQMDFGFLLSQRKPVVFKSSEKIAIGEKHQLSADIIRVIVTSKRLDDATYEYVCYQFKKVIHPFTAVFRSYESQCESILSVMDDSDSQIQFAPLKSKLKSLITLARKIENHVETNADMLKRAFLKPKDKNRAADIKSLAEKINEHMQEMRMNFDAAKDSISTYLKVRNDLFNTHIPALFIGLKNERDILGSLADVCHMIQQSDRASVLNVTAYIEEAMYHLSCVESMLLPPQIPQPNNTQAMVLFNQGNQDARETAQRSAQKLQTMK